MASENFIGEVRMFGGNFAPAGWLPCDGRVLPISEYDVLFALIGTTYGGDGQSTFQLPDFRGRFPVHNSPSLPIGATMGVETVTLQQNQLAGHGHQMYGSAAVGTDANPQAKIPGSLPAAGTIAAYNTRAPFGALDATSIGPTGGSRPHNNIQPYLCVTFIIAYEGIFPSQT
jgi:microcystin-dependent protein